jgi:PHD/YefM family antitoxin component YafN of YafNO toxin-antitoxin module
MATATFEQLPSIASSQLLAKFHNTAAVVAKKGAVLVTRHGQPSLVLVSLDRYQALELASSPDLTALTGEFDALYAEMQAAGQADRMDTAFAMQPLALGKAAIAAATIAPVVDR